MRQLIECVPNFSEGRRMDVIDRIAQAVTAVPTVRLLDRSSDADHHRTVLTFVGAPDAVAEAAFQAIRTAAEWIDLDQHQGVHPRIGATDVVPFIPLEGVTMADCIALALRLGARVGAELGLPVYLYEEAAARPENRSLAALRKGGYEGLKAAIRTDPTRQPDYGPQQLGSAGAVVIGARPALIAFNVYLTTPDVQIAQRIAQVIRHQDGGLRFVKALGLLVGGKAQVSMNLTDHTKTTLHHAVEMIRREAARYGAGIASTELIGLIPQRALLDAAAWYLQLDGFTPNRVLETHLLPERDGSAFLDALASAHPTPAGGSATAYAGAMAAALVGMAARVTMANPRYTAARPRMYTISAEADALRVLLEQHVREDAQVYDALIAARRRARAEQDSPHAQALLEQAVLKAAQVPLEAGQTALRVLELAAETAAISTLGVLGDLNAAASLAHTALETAAFNVRINVRGIVSAAADDLRQRAAHLHTAGRALTDQVQERVRARPDDQLSDG